jgi:hypothetical protein
MAFFVGAKLASDSDLKDAIAGKPCSYRSTTLFVGAELAPGGVPTMAISKTPSPASRAPTGQQRSL